jgi:hypothetical protein
MCGKTVIILNFESLVLRQKIKESFLQKVYSLEFF